jgi:RHS repeat-associated protein
VINYTYDSLYRLTAADYSSGPFFHYTYDAVGNRLTEVTQTGTTPYVYDIANRLISVSGVTYVWDPRGNLISDGASTYAYDRANRMITAVQGANNYAFAYNGLGDRLRQTVNAVPTDYRLDLEAGLTQVLSDGTNTYLYGLTRVGEKQPGGWQYHLGDALGSVRQLIDTSASITLARSYEPFGDTVTSAGSASTLFRYAGEQTDATGLTYLRARYLSTLTGRFLQRDPSGVESNSYLYAGANPVNWTDPSGLFSPDQIASSFGYGSFESLMLVLDSLDPYLFLPDDDKWGFFAALLDAEEGDTLQAGAVVLSAIYPYVGYASPKRLWLLGCDEVMVGSLRLADYFDYVLVQPNYGQLAMQFWRDTSSSYYVLRTSNSIAGYVDGSTMTDLPDFHSIEVSAPIKGPVGMALAGIADRFGNYYFLVGGGWSPIPIPQGGVSYSEGYICANPYSGTCLTTTPSLRNDSEIRETLTKWCASAGAQAGYGGVVFGCESGGVGVVFSAGVSYFAGVTGTFGIYLGRDESLGWNWAIEDRLAGVTIERLLAMADQ